MPKRDKNIRKRKDGRWEGRYKHGTKADGKTCYKSVYGKTYKEVQNKIQLLSNQPLSPYNQNSKITFEEVAQDWLDEILLCKKYSTYVKYNTVYTKHIKSHIGPKEIQHITGQDCMDLLQYEYNHGNKNKSTLSKSSLNSISNVLKQILSFGSHEITIELPKNKPGFSNMVPCRNISVFSTEEQTKLEEFLLKDMDSYKLGILICLFSGLRLGEICALTTDNILIEQKTLHVTQTVQRIKSENNEKKTELLVSTPKTFHSTRDIPICENIIDILKKNMPSTKYLVNGNLLMEPRTYQYKFKRYLEKVSIENKNFHSLRHTFATNCIENGMDPKCLSELLGHANVQTTLNKYVHPSFESKLKQINLLLPENGQFSGQIQYSEI